MPPPAFRSEEVFFLDAGNECVNKFTYLLKYGINQSYIGMGLNCWLIGVVDFSFRYGFIIENGRVPPTTQVTTAVSCLNKRCYGGFGLKNRHSPHLFRNMSAEHHLWAISATKMGKERAIPTFQQPTTPNFYWVCDEKMSFIQPTAVTGRRRFSPLLASISQG